MPPIIEELKDKKIAIMGFGREGRSFYSYIRSYLPEKELVIMDANEIDLSDVTHVQLIHGAQYQNADGFDIVCKSPGIVLESNKYLDVMDSMTNLFLKHYGKQTIGITGTKGKSTTASLLYHMLKENGLDAVLIGNIGKPAFDEIERIHEDTIVIYELSCHQLEYGRYSPHIAVYLNLHEEHLDHYGSFAAYQHAKENIWRHQREKDVLICEKTLVQDAIPSNIITASMEDVQADIYAFAHGFTLGSETITLQPQDSTLLGHHNMYDIAIDAYIAQSFGIDMADILASLRSFTPLPHRLQYIGEYHGIHWYDDSISTICETTIQALKSLPETDTLLVGGMDRGIDYTPLAEYLKKHPVKHLILMPDSGEILSKLLPKQTLYHADNLEEAVALAKHYTCAGRIALLSPAAASYGFFKNFEDRGEQFQKFVKSE